MAHSAPVSHTAESGDEIPSRWSARFVGAPSNGPARLFRREFVVEADIASATLGVTYLGIGRMWINGEIVGDEVLEPGWQSYHHRLLLRQHAVTQRLRRGRNVIVAEVGPGWYSGRVGFFEQRNVYGDGVAVFAQLDLRFRDGSESIVGTDSEWVWSPGPTLEADLYDGETFDARRRIGATVDHTDWRPVGLVDYPVERLRLPVSPPVRRIEEVVPVSITRSPSGKVIVDFGRNVVGWTRLTVAGPSGSEIVLRYAEVLENEELGTRPLRSAKATDRYILDDSGIQTWEPAFTYHGFRYVEVSGWPGGSPSAEEILAVVVRSDLPRVGWFRTSHSGLSQLHSNVVASLQGNFVSIPTDCPQRDERLGWTGDIAVFAPTASFLYDCTGFLSEWLRDVALEQEEDGRIPLFVPDVPFPDDAKNIDPQFDRARPAVWGDAATLVPFALYQATGDLQPIAENFDLMRRWVDGVRAVVGPDLVWDTGFQFGDWLDPAAPPDAPADGATETALVATAYFEQSARLVGRAAKLLGREEGAEYTELADRIRTAFQGRFIQSDGSLTSDSQTAYAIGLQLDLLNDVAVQYAAARLPLLVRAAGHRIGTGFVGTPLILDALTKVGAISDAYRLLLQTEAPSWLYAVSMGATTIWERWDSMLPDGSINSGEMTSFNHYALGAVASWLHGTVAGLTPAEPGYRAIRFAPRPRGPLTDAGATHHTPLGVTSVDWRLHGGSLELDVVIPDGATGVIDIEGREPFERAAGSYSFTFPFVPSS